jgi:creatinine amidohydrolase
MARRLDQLTSPEVSALVAGGRACVLLPVGSVEPHGPHLPLATDSWISEVACARAADELGSSNLDVVIAPTLPFGVTDYAAGFAGAIGVRPEVLTAFLADLVRRLLADGFRHVCIVNNHLEPAHDAAVRAALEGTEKGRASVACPLERRFGRTLSAEFKSGACHAGRYETSLVLAARPDDVRADYKDLGALELSLSAGILAGKKTFAEIGMARAYTGAPAEASAAEGRELYERLADMIVVTVKDALGTPSA